MLLLLEIRDPVHVFEALPRLLDLTKAVRTEFQGAAPHLAFLLQLPRCQWRKMSAVAGSMGSMAKAGPQELSEVVHAKEEGVAHKY
jgi:hypothetical protein